jgi:hypothetical protein
MRARGPTARARPGDDRRLSVTFERRTTARDGAQEGTAAAVRIG